MCPTVLTLLLRTDKTATGLEVAARMWQVGAAGLVVPLTYGTETEGVRRVEYDRLHWGTVQPTLDHSGRNAEVM